MVHLICSMIHRYTQKGLPYSTRLQGTLPLAWARVSLAIQISMTVHQQQHGGYDYFFMLIVGYLLPIKSTRVQSIEFPVEPAVLSNLSNNLLFGKISPDYSQTWQTRIYSELRSSSGEMLRYFTLMGSK